MRLYVYELKWYGDDISTFVIIEANTMKDSKSILICKCKEKEWSIDFTRCICKRLILENGVYCIN